MRTIKTRDRVQSKKAPSTSPQMGRRMQKALLRDRQKGATSAEDRQDAPDQYAQDKVESTAQDVTRRMGHGAVTGTTALARRGKAFARHQKTEGDTGTAPETPIHEEADTIDPMEQGRTLAKRRFVERTQTERRSRQAPAPEETGGEAPSPLAVIGERARRAKTPKRGEQAIKRVTKQDRTTQQAAQAFHQAAQRTRAAAKQHAKSARTIPKRAGAAVRAVSRAAQASPTLAIARGGVVLAVVLVVCLIGALATSPFGILLAQEPANSNTLSVAQAVSQVNLAYTAQLETLQAGGYDSVVIQGQTPDWPEVLAVFAVKLAGTDAGGTDVVTLDQDRVAQLAGVFWDMTAITTEVETIDHPGDGEDDGWTESILHITITPRTAEEMRTIYAFTAQQNSALDQLLQERALLLSLAGDLTLSADETRILEALPDDLSPKRRQVVETALQLVGKVNYFWGGKSTATGWDSRWGQLAQVTAAGDSTTGTYRPFGLDCTGFLDWALRNSGLSSDGHWYIGTNLTAVSQGEAQPGDFALFPDASHIGIVVGWDENGDLLVCHCSSSRGGVVVTGFAAAGFTVIGRPAIY